MDPNLRDQAAAYVLGALEPDAARAFEQALQASPALRREVDELREVAALLPLGAGAGAPPRDDEALKARLLHRIRRRPAAAHRHTRTWLSLGWAAAAVAVVAVGVQQRRLAGVRERLAVSQRAVDSLATQFAEREATLALILGRRTTLIQLTAAGGVAPGVQLFFNPEANAVVLHAEDLPPAPAGRAYQLWFLGEAAPVPGGTFNTDPDGRTLVALDGPPAGVNFAGAAVTQEPAGGSPAPTSAIVVAGNRSE